MGSEMCIRDRAKDKRKETKTSGPSCCGATKASAVAKPTTKAKSSSSSSDDSSSVPRVISIFYDPFAENKAEACIARSSTSLWRRCKCQLRRRSLQRDSQPAASFPPAVAIQNAPCIQDTVSCRDGSPSAVATVLVSAPLVRCVTALCTRDAKTITWCAQCMARPCV